jgi:hypothetical protein
MISDVFEKFIRGFLVLTDGFSTLEIFSLMLCLIEKALLRVRILTGKGDHIIKISMKLNVN